MTTHLISVDPGTKATGVAFFTHGALRAVDLFSRGSSHEKVSEVYHFFKKHLYVMPTVEKVHGAIEFPQIYAGYSKSEADPNDLLVLAAQVGAIDYVLSQLGVLVARYKPADWKGQTKKAQIKARVLATLSEDERKIPIPSSKSLDVFEAIGIGLHHLGRGLPEDVTRWNPA